MKKCFRIALLALTTLCFGLNATNTVLVLHLAKHHHDKSHDSEHCSLCQQAAVNITKAVLPGAPLVTGLPLVNKIISVIYQYVRNFELLTPYMRAPPAAA